MRGRGMGIYRGGRISGYARALLGDHQLANFAQALRFARRTPVSVLLLSHGPILCTAVWPTLLPSWSVWRNAVWPAMPTRDVALAFNLATKQDLDPFD